MKNQRSLLLIACLAAGSAMAQPTLTTSSESSTDIMHPDRLHWLAPVPATGTNGNRKPIQGLSPQAWSTTVGWSPGASAFPDARTSSFEMPLVWAAHGPWNDDVNSVNRP